MCFLGIRLLEHLFGYHPHKSKGIFMDERSVTLRNAYYRNVLYAIEEAWGNSKSDIYRRKAGQKNDDPIQISGASENWRF